MHGNDLQFLKQRSFADLPMMRIFRYSVPDLLQQKRAVMGFLKALPLHTCLLFRLMSFLVQAEKTLQLHPY
jgi:hypothetical protein